MLRQFGLIVLIVLFVGCSANEPITDVPFATVTPRPIETLQQPQSFGDSQIPAEFAGGDPIILGDFGTFRLSVTGEFTSDLSTGTVIYNFLTADERLPARNQLYISSSDNTSSQELIFQFTPAIELGQYTLVAPTDYAPGNVSMSYSRLVFDGSETRIAVFNENIDGTLTISRIGEAVSGQFQFSADFVETSIQGEVDVQSVQVTGRFDDVPYQVTLRDPFEISVPLPTRNFETTSQP